MSRAPKTMSLIDALGFQPSDTPAEAAASLRVVSVSFEQLNSMISHWRSRSLESRPRLHGIAATPGSDRGLRLLLDLGRGEPVVCIDAKIPGAESVLPDLREIWPYCGWWQRELAVFHEFKFGGEVAGGVVWRQA